MSSSSNPVPVINCAIGLISLIYDIKTANALLNTAFPQVNAVTNLIHTAIVDDKLEPAAAIAKVMLSVNSKVIEFIDYIEAVCELQYMIHKVGITKDKDTEINIVLTYFQRKWMTKYKKERIDLKVLKSALESIDRLISLTYRNM